MTTQDQLAEAGHELVTLGAALYDRGLTPGRTGNLSVRVGDTVVMTPTGVSLGRLAPSRLAHVDLDGTSINDVAPTKEHGLHLALYHSHRDVGAVAHGHTLHAVAWSCLTDIDTDDALPVLTAYYAMRVGRLPLLAFAPPGDARLADAIAEVGTRCALLAHHGSIAAAPSLEAAVDALEEIEVTAQLALLLRGHPSRSLDIDQMNALRPTDLGGPRPPDPSRRPA